MESGFQLQPSGGSLRVLSVQSFARSSSALRSGRAGWSGDVADVESRLLVPVVSVCTILLLSGF